MKAQYPFTNSFSIRLITASLIGLVIAFLMVFLQPYDTYNTTFEYKNLKLLGYSFVCFFIYLLIFPLELFLYHQLRKWNVWIELSILMVFTVLVTVSTYLYHHLIFSGPEPNINDFFAFTFRFSWAFILLIIPLLGYMRLNYGNRKIALPSQQAKQITLYNQAQSESLQINSADLLFIEAQQNYIAIHHLDGEGKIQKKLLRNTLSKVSELLDNVVPTHRSYLVNLQRAQDLAGNKRKAHLRLKEGDFELPVSQPYYDSIKEMMQNQP